MYPGLLDDEQLQAAYNQFKVNPIAMDPWRMALYQAGQGIATGEGARLDQVLRGAAQGGVEGYNQGLQNQLMYEQAMQAMQAKEEEERKKRETEEIERKYREALTRQADATAASALGTLNRPEAELQRYREQVIGLFPDPTNQTRQYLLAAGPSEGQKVLAKYAGQPALNETQRADLLNLINNSKALTGDQKKALRGMANERDQDGKLSNNYNAVMSEIRQEEAKNAPAKPAAGPKLDDNNRILLMEGMTEESPEAQIAFNNAYGLPAKTETQFNKDGSQTQKSIYKKIPDSIRARYPNLSANRDRIESVSQESTKRPSQQVLQAKGVADEMAAIEAEIQKYQADVPLDFMDNLKNVAVELLPDSIESNFQSETYKRNRALQKEWQILVLRDESGAAIGEDEYKNYDKIYFSQPGDSVELIMAKRRARARAMQERALIAEGIAQGGTGPSVRDFAYKHAREFGIPIPEVDQPTVQDPSVEGMNIPEEGKQYLR